MIAHDCPAERGPGFKGIDVSTLPPLLAFPASTRDLRVHVVADVPRGVEDEHSGNGDVEGRSNAPSLE